MIFETHLISCVSDSREARQSVKPLSTLPTSTAGGGDYNQESEGQIQVGSDQQCRGVQAKSGPVRGRLLLQRTLQ